MLIFFELHYIYQLLIIMYSKRKENPASILYKSIAGRYRSVSYPDGPITARYRFIKNAYWEATPTPWKPIFWMIHTKANRKSEKAATIVKQEGRGGPASLTWLPEKDKTETGQMIGHPTCGSEEDFQRVFTLYGHVRHLGNVTRTNHTNFCPPQTKYVPHKIWLQSAQWFLRKRRLKVDESLRIGADNLLEKMMPKERP